MGGSRQERLSQSGRYARSEVLTRTSIFKPHSYIFVLSIENLRAEFCVYALQFCFRASLADMTARFNGLVSPPNAVDRV